MLESRIERQLTNWCDEQGILSRKYTTPGRRGAPDHIFFYQGKVALIEFKQKGKTPDALQVVEMAVLQSHNIPVSWFDDVSKARVWLTEVLKGEEK